MEDNNIDENLDSSPEEVEEVPEAPAEETVVSEDVNTPKEEAPQPAPKTGEKTVPYDRFKEVNEELQKLKKAPAKVVNNSLDVEDYIEISASLEGLDQREKEYLAKQHKLTGDGIKDIHESEDFGFWQEAYRGKVEKEKALKPSNNQGESTPAQNLTEKLASASMKDKEALLKKYGLYRDHSPRAKRNDRVDIQGKY